MKFISDVTKPNCIGLFLILLQKTNIELKKIGFFYDNAVSVDHFTQPARKNIIGLILH